MPVSIWFPHEFFSPPQSQQRVLISYMLIYYISSSVPTAPPQKKTKNQRIKVAIQGWAWLSDWSSSPKLMSQYIDPSPSEFSPGTRTFCWSPVRLTAAAPWGIATCASRCQSWPRPCCIKACSCSWSPSSTAARKGCPSEASSSARAVAEAAEGMPPSGQGMERGMFFLYFFVFHLAWRLMIGHFYMAMVRCYLACGHKGLMNHMADSDHDNGPRKTRNNKDKNRQEHQAHPQIPPGSSSAEHRDSRPSQGHATTTPEPVWLSSRCWPQLTLRARPKSSRPWKFTGDQVPKPCSSAFS